MPGTNYRSCVFSRKRDPYAASEPRRFGWPVITGGLLGAFALGIGAGWLTSLLPGFLLQFQDGGEPPLPSASRSGLSLGPAVPVDIYPVIDRTLDTVDTTAGLSSLDIVINATGIFDVVESTDPAASTGVTRWVRIEVEQGQPVSGAFISDYAIDILNDERGWGTGGRYTFARTSGAAEIRLIFASPTTIGAFCPDRHAARDLGIAPPDAPIDLGELASILATPSITASPSPEAAAADATTASPSPSASPEPRVACVQRGIIMIDLYSWAAGLDAFPEDRAAAHTYLLQHAMGHYLGEEDRTCRRGTASVMVNVADQEALGSCTANAWPFPDAAPAEE